MIGFKRIHFAGLEICCIISKRSCMIKSGGHNIDSAKMNDVCLTKTALKSSQIQRILSNYRTVFVKESFISHSKQNGGITLWSKLGIDNPWYCNDTGHMNAVELNLAFNQMVYVSIYYGISYSLIPQLNKFPVALENYMDKAWPDFLITKIESQFVKPIHVSDFSGALRIKNITQSSSDRHLFFDIDLTAAPGSQEFSQPGNITHAYSRMELAIKNYKYM